MTAIATGTDRGHTYVMAAEAGLTGGVVYTLTATLTDGTKVLCNSHRSKAKVARWLAASVKSAA